jgi:hypothetical protein
MNGAGQTVHELALVSHDGARDEDVAYETAADEPVKAERTPLILAGIAAFLWLALAAASLFLILRYRPIAGLGLVDWAALVAGITAPLALIGVALLAWLRLNAVARLEQSLQSRALARAATERSHQDLASVERMLFRIGAAMEAERTRFVGERDALIAAGDRLTTDAAAASDALARQCAEIGQRAALFDGAAAGARTELGIMLADLPQIEAAARALAQTLGDGTRTAHARAEEIGGRLTALRSESDAVAVAADQAGALLNQRIAALDTASAETCRKIAQQADTLQQVVDQAIGRSETALEATRHGLSAQSESLGALIQQNQSALEIAGAEASRVIEERSALLIRRTEELGERLGKQQAVASRMTEALDNTLGDLSARLEALSTDGDQRTAVLAAQLAAIRAEIEGLTAPIAEGEAASRGLIEQATALRGVLSESATLLVERLPIGLSSTQEALGAARGDLDAAHTLLDRIGERQATLTDAGRQLATVMDESGQSIERTAAAAIARLSEAGERLAVLTETLGAFDHDSETISLSAGGRLLELVNRVRDASAQATSAARETLDAVVEETRNRLATAAGESLATAVDEPIQQRLQALSGAAESAMASARNASEQLARQMMTIAETTATVETRIADANQRMEAASKEDFARRSALLIESLNSLAIDIGKVMTNEVSDVAWASYLKGDRTIFARRAVRLLDSGDVRAIQRHYDGDADFREGVNRYVHDFEAMIRRVMADRDGGPMAVTLLSSDIGKLYAALAQAIDRLRK